MNPYFTLSVPAFADFFMKYYCQSDNQIYEPRIFSPHIDDGVELYILTEGDVSFTVEDRLYPLAPGDVLLTKPGEMHNCILNSEGFHRHYCFWFGESDGFLLGDFLSHAPGEGNRICPRGADRETIGRVCRTLHETSCRGGDPLGEYALAVRLLSLVHRNLDSHGEADTGVFPPVLRRILRDMDGMLPPGAGVQYFEEKYFISRSTLTRHFRKYLNTSPMTYLETKRLATACALLKDGMSVTEVAARSGFPDYSNFIRLFRKRFGVTPLQYRNAPTACDFPVAYTEE